MQASKIWNTSNTDQEAEMKMKGCSRRQAIEMNEI